MQEVKLKELVALVNKELVKRGYHKKTIAIYNRAWQFLVKCFDAKKEEFFSLNTAMRILEEECKFFEKRERGLLDVQSKRLYQSICLLSDCNLHRVIFRRSDGKMYHLTKEVHWRILEGFQSYCASRYAFYTIEGYGRSARKLLYFIDARDILIGDLSSDILCDFVKTLFGYSPKMVEFTFSGIKCFLRYLHEHGYLSTDFSASLPKVKVPQKARIPSVWEEETLEKLLEVIDKGNPSGKRDYAIIMLASMLGMRAIDICKMKFQNINWEERRIDIVQSKSQRSVTYPLLSVIGWAIIDYVRHGRPECECPEIFVTHTLPHRPFSCSASLDNMILKYMKQAHISVRKDKKYGMHSLRHTYATSLMEKHFPIEDIAQLMGHVNPNTTAIYLKSSIGLLSECALTIEDES